MSLVERKNQIRNAYRLTGKNSFYDGMITGTTFWGRFVCHLVWDMNAKENSEYLMRALSGIPENFSGRLLEVPVGTGVLTMPLYQMLPGAEIVCLDYSPDMMGRAERRAKRLKLKNIDFKQGDVGMLPFEDSSFNIVLSLNGFHAFPDKDAAYKEIFRVLKSGGTFCGCFYVSGLCKRTDFFIQHLYQPLKFFTPPYETIKSLNVRLKSMYEQVELDHVKGIVCFVCKKSGSL